jgi:hypothetical protein
MSPTVEVTERIEQEYHQLYLPFVSEEEKRELRERESLRVSIYEIKVYQRDFELDEQTSEYAYEIFNDALAIAEKLANIDATMGRHDDEDFDPWADIVFEASVGGWHFSVKSMIDCGEIELRIKKDQTEQLMISCPSPLELSFEPHGDAHEMEVLATSSRFCGWYELASQLKQVRENIEQK